MIQRICVYLDWIFFFLRLYLFRSDTSIGWRLILDALRQAAHGSLGRRVLPHIVSLYLPQTLHLVLELALISSQVNS